MSRGVHDSTALDYDAVYRTAVRMIDGEWLDAGEAIEDLEQEEKIQGLVGRMLAAGLSAEEIIEEIFGSSNSRIDALLAKYPSRA
jgi:hypothetical protein